MHSPFRILIVEDDVDARASWKDILELDGHEITVAGSIRELEILVHRQKFNLILTDRQLPDGLIDRSLIHIREAVPNCEIVVVTGYADLESTINAVRLGVTDYCIKPILPEVLRGTVHRIAMNQRLQRELDEEHLFAEEVLCTADAIILILDLDGCVIRFNPFFETLTGWTLAELKGRDWFESCLTSSEHERIKRVFYDTARFRHTHGVVNDIVGRNGKLYRIRWSNSTLQNSLGEDRAILAVGVDITDLIAAQTMAVRAGRLAAIGQTMTAIAHESRNALQRIKAAAEVLELETSNVPDAREEIHSILRACSDMQHLFEEIRTFAAPIVLQLAVVNVSESWRNAWQNLAVDRRGRDVTLVEHFQSREVAITIDPNRLQQAFRNIFENSLIACVDPVRIEVTYAIDESLVRITIADNGPGLNEEQQTRLFEPFYTTRSTGTGLGMSICERVIRTHGGSIRFEPRPQGACFVIELPLEPSGGPLRHTETLGDVSPVASESSEHEFA